MAPKESRLRINRTGAVIHVGVLDHKLVDDSVIRQVGEELGALIETESAPKLVVDFAQVEYLSSLALGTLIAIYNKVKAKKGQLRLVGLAPTVHDVLHNSGLDTLFEIHESFGAAVDSFGG